MDTFTQAYVTAALWTSTCDDGDEPLDKNHSAEDIHPDTMTIMVEDCLAFQDMCGCMFADRTGNCLQDAEAQAGHDFWLTRNGHGCGYWDGDYTEPSATTLAEVSKAFGTYDLYVGDDGAIYGNTRFFISRDKAPQGATAGEIWLDRPENNFSVTQHGEPFAVWNKKTETWQTIA
jgi:hypothetical protein